MTKDVAAQDIPFVHEGLDRWLFLIGGTNLVTSLYRRDGGNLPDVKLALWRDAILERKRRCDALGIAYAHMIAPEKLTIYGHKLREPIVDIELAPAIRLNSLFGGDAERFGVVDLVGPMRKYRDETKLYFWTDTHWTPEGTLVSYKILCDFLGIPWNPELPTRPFHVSRKFLDLGSKLTPRIDEWKRDYFWMQHARRVEANRVVEILETPAFEGQIHVGAHAVFTNPSPTCEAKILLFGDSFSTADPHMLTALLAETVREVEFVWSANIDWDLVERVKPDILITEIAERYMAVPPNDRFDLRRAERAQVMRAYRERLKSWWKKKRGKSSVGAG